jgi:4-oxalocrotonate tautomerase
MPIIHVDMAVGRTLEQKRRLVKALTEAVCSSINAKPSDVDVVLNELDRTNLSRAGLLLSDEMANPPL